MKYRDLKKLIRDEYADEAPDISSEIIASCKTQTQLAPPSSPTKAAPTLPSSFMLRRALACAVCLVVFISGAILGFFIPRETGVASVETVVYLDVNPSIELQVGSDGRVIQCIAANDDAVSVMRGIDITGVEMNTALSAIVGAMYVNGYLTKDANSILISVDTVSHESDALLSSISERVAEVFEGSEIDCSIIAQSLDVEQRLIERADELGISVGKLCLVDKMAEGIDSISEENISELSTLSISELSLIYSTRVGGSEEIFGGDVVTGTVGGFLGRDEALTYLLDAIDLRSELLSGYESYASYEAVDGQAHLVYCVSINLVGDLGVYSFKVDCQSGEVLEFDLDINIPGLDI